MALSLVLLVASGLMTRAYWHLENVTPGFDPRNALAVDLAVPAAFYPEEGQVDGYYQAVLERVQAVPGVVAAGAVDILPLVGWNPGTGFRAEGSDDADAERRADLQPISPDYFRAMGVPIVRGRTVSEGERRHRAPVAVVNARFARMVWPDAEPLGKRLRLEEEPGVPSGPWLTIIGVAGDVRQFGIQEEPRPEIYVAAARRTMALVVRTTEDPSRLAERVMRTVRAVDPGLPVPAARTLEAAVADSLSAKRLAAICFGVLAGVASLLAALGLYGVMSYSVGRRTREIGIRLALGESTGSVTWLVLRQCATLTLAGVGLGLLGALATTPMLRSALYGVSPLDPVTFVGASLLLTVVALAACWPPLRAATRLDPVAALREE
jgi:putative ABC transport system permease protein